jgi:hypothetical protein
MSVALSDVFIILINELAWCSRIFY